MLATNAFKIGKTDYGFGAKLYYVTDILQAYDASVAAGTPMLTADGKPAWTGQNGIDASYLGQSTNHKLANAKSLPTDANVSKWNGFYWIANSNLLGTQYDAKSMWAGYASVIAQYAQELESWLKQVSTGMQDPKNQSTVMNYSQYRSGDLQQSSGLMDWIGQLISSGGTYIGTVFGGGLSKAAPSVFGYTKALNADTTDSTVVTNVSDTVSGVDKLIDIVMGVIQNSIVH